MKSALHIAVASGQIEMIELLLSSKHTDINAEDKERATPIFYSVSKKNLEILKYLAEKGANLNHREI